MLVPIVLQRVVIVPGAGMLTDYRAFMSGFVPRKLIYSAICSDLMWMLMVPGKFIYSIICSELMYSPNCRELMYCTIHSELMYSAMCSLRGLIIWSGMWIGCLMFGMSIARKRFMYSGICRELIWSNIWTGFMCSGICRELIWSGMWTGLLMLSKSIARRVFTSGSFDRILEPTAHQMILSRTRVPEGIFVDETLEPMRYYKG